ncbi:MAG TPA: four-carbon acid sugar kinase family protein [Verrucomicrobiae bacterium]|nr:four-carbon acid sugar kinase family protein [Verrucomicrobiae bacterium]
MSKLLLAFYGDDFTGSTDALEQLTLAGVRTVLFTEPPTPAQLKHFPKLQAVGVAGFTRSLPAAAMEKELRPAFKKLKALGARHIHYKVCSTFDSSPEVGSIGRAIEVGMEVFHPPFVPLLVAAPALGRYGVFGNLFARFGIGSDGAIHRLDRHPSASRHPVTPMTEADLRLHLAKQTERKVALFDILKVTLPATEARMALRQILAERPDIVLFDALHSEHLAVIGGLVDTYASARRPLFSVGSSGIEMALGAFFNLGSSRRKEALTQFPDGKKEPPYVGCYENILVGSGSCSPVTESQIAWARKRGFAEVALDASALASPKKSGMEIQRATGTAAKLLQTGGSVIVHTTPGGSVGRITAKLRGRSAPVLGMALGTILRNALVQKPVRRLCIAGGDTSSYAARAMGIEALEMMMPLTPGAPLCRVHAPDSPVDGCEIVFKGGQVGAENYFEIVRRGKV